MADKVLTTEQSLIGYLLNKPEDCEICLQEGLTAQDLPTLGKVFAWIVNKVSSPEGYDFQSCLTTFKSQQMDLITWSTDAPVTFNVKYYVKRLLASDLQRRWREVLFQEIKSVDKWNDTQPVSHLTDSLARVVSFADASDSEKIPNKLYTGQDLANIALETVRKYEQRKREGRPIGYSTGIPIFDQLCGGLMNSMTTYLIARTSVGKSTLASAMTTHLSNNKVKVFFASTEMDEKLMSVRFACSASNTDKVLLRDGNLNDKQLDRFFDGLRRVSQWPIIFFSMKKKFFENLIFTVKREHRRGNFDVLVIDHFHDLKTQALGPEKYEQLYYIASEINNLSSELGIPIVIAAQINREGEKAEGTDVLKHIEGCGKIEQLTDNVIHLRRLDGQYVINIAKNREGPICDGQLINLNVKSGALLE